MKEKISFFYHLVLLRNFVIILDFFHYLLARNGTHMNPWLHSLMHDYNVRGAKLPTVEG